MWLLIGDQDLTRRQRWHWLLDEEEDLKITSRSIEEILRYALLNEQRELMARFGKIECRIEIIQEKKEEV